MDVNGLVDKINAWYPIVVSVGGAILVIVLAYRGINGGPQVTLKKKTSTKGVKNVAIGGGIMICAAVIWGFIKSTFGG